MAQCDSTLSREGRHKADAMLGVGGTNVLAPTYLAFPFPSVTPPSITMILHTRRLDSNSTLRFSACAGIVGEVLTEAMRRRAIQHATISWCPTTKNSLGLHAGP